MANRKKDLWGIAAGVGIVAATALGLYKLYKYLEAQQAQTPLDEDDTQADEDKIIWIKRPDDAGETSDDAGAPMNLSEALDDDRVQATLDLNGDGTPDAALLDTTGDGKPDLVLADTTGDGNVDTALMDLDGDGSYDAAIVTQEEEKPEA